MSAWPLLTSLFLRRTREHQRTMHRNSLHGASSSSRSMDHHGGSCRVHWCAFRFGLVGSRHPLASLFPGLDVRCNDRFKLESESLGLLHRYRRGSFLELHESFCNQFLEGRSESGGDPPAHRPTCAPRPLYLRACMDRQSYFDPRLCSRLYPAFRQKSDRCVETCDRLRGHHSIFRAHHGPFPA
jgi:hypothetical protein